MKFLVILGIIISTQIGGQPQSVTLRGEVASPNADIFYLYQYGAWSWQPLDSVLLEENEFELTVDTPHRGRYKKGPDLETNFDLILGESRLESVVDYSDDLPEVNFVQSPENRALSEYVQFIRTLQEPARLIEVWPKHVLNYPGNCSS